MINNIWLSLFLAFIIGITTGIFYFAGLWLTVKRVTKITKPYLLLILSFFIRLSIILPIFYVVFKDNSLNILPCVGGFFLVRFISLNIVSQKPDQQRLEKS